MRKKRCERCGDRAEYTLTPEMSRLCPECANYFMQYRDEDLIEWLVKKE